MSTPFNNLISNKNIAISNSIILNNYSIQNVIISPKNIIEAYEKFPLKAENYFQLKKTENNFPSTPKKPIIQKTYNKIQPSPVYKYTTPMVTKK